MAELTDLSELKRRYAEVHDLRMAAAVLHWDQEVLMPPKGARGRGEQLSTLASLGHRLFTSADFGRLLEACAQAEHAAADDALTVGEMAYDHARATKLPEAFVAEFTEAQSAAYHAWVKARAASDFTAFQPHLERMVTLSRRKADYYGYEDSPYDALLEDYERGVTTAQLKPLFGHLAARQKEIVAAIAAAPAPDLAWLDQDWSEDAQWSFSMQVLRDLGYDFDAGRQDKSVHPFTIHFDRDDVRITTRLHPRELFSALTGSIHECGHALYEQGFRPEDRRTVLGQAIGLGIHESQSRLYENMIGRSLPFWTHYAPALQEAFPGQLNGIGKEDIHRAINAVQPSLIRVEADECTYNLHVILRFEIEQALIEGTMRVDEVPEAWNAKMRDYLGLEVPNDAQGCLQDIHWSHGSLGYFPTYTLGNLYAAQLMEVIVRDLPTLWTDIEEGRFGPLLDWLREKVHRVGRRQQAPALIESITGSPPDSGPFLRYLEGKYGDLYGIDLGASASASACADAPRG